ncbi:thioesterase family protein [Sphingomonas sp. RP10(2022)]|uniref:Thioesterase family protein n=1 Tax=Sphingomonas liriopis TaxID=2949094 RepID=A0A9X2HQ70_9SPHN|nr:thioesterase family protein [Sphingomonas liriopis]MCP3733409.1 thioesterase family protein [Sphingomonas liriopis]
MTTLAEVIAALEPVEGGWRGTVPEGWLQGRTTYGGLSSALALHAAMASDTDLPPLRSALVAFVGPLNGAVTVSATRLRRGRNAAFVQADVTSDAGLGLRATFVFMGAAPSAVDHRTGTAPEIARPGPDHKVLRGHPAIAFSRNFELVEGRDAGPAEWLRWVRLKERDGLDPMVELIAVADCLPPAALKLVGRPAPVSSMTWQLNLLGSAPVTEDGWWLLRATTDYAQGGNSNQRMGIWAADGTPVADGMQSVAVFA